MTETIVHEIDCKNLNCPLPVLKTKKAVENIQIGQILKVTTTDPASKNDMMAWAKRTENQMVKIEENTDFLVFYIQRIK